MLSKLVLYPSILYARTLEYMGIRQWYNRIDEICVLGALPMLHNYKEIIKAENVKAVLTLNEDHELEYSIPKSEWNNLGIDYLQIQVRDYVGVASLDQLKAGVEFIKKHKSQNETVYVHCKAGRYRSALMVACYLCNEKKLKPEEAAAIIKEIRPIVILSAKRQMIALTNYYNYINAKK